MCEDCGEGAESTLVKTANIEKSLQVRNEDLVRSVHL